MKYITKLKLAVIHQLCILEDKSTEYTIAYMMNACNVNHDTAVAYLTLNEAEHARLIKEVNEYNVNPCPDGLYMADRQYFIAGAWRSNFTAHLPYYEALNAAITKALELI
jgi:hypothetical protein